MARAAFVCPEEPALSTEPIVSSPSASQQPVLSCPACAAPLAPGQRYCLECGERQVQMSSLLSSQTPLARQSPAAPPAPPGSPPAAPAGGQRNTLLLIAGVGVLMLAMGVGVLIGRSSVSKTNPGPAQVITVGGTAGGTQATSGTAETLTGDWKATKGFTVELESLPSASTSVGAVETAKSAATGKGASAVGALDSEEFSSLTSGQYVIYSGEYKKRSEAEHALGSLKKKFPSAKVIEVSNGAASSSSKGKSGSSEAGSGGGSSSKSSLEHPAPASVLKGESKAKGKEFEEKSKELPDVVETG